MGQRRKPFQIRFHYGPEDLREIVQELARDAVRKNGDFGRPLTPARHRITDAASRFAAKSSRREQ